MVRRMKKCQDAERTLEKEKTDAGKGDIIRRNRRPVTGVYIPYMPDHMEIGSRNFEPTD